MTSEMTFLEMSLSEEPIVLRSTYELKEVAREVGVSKYFDSSLNLKVWSTNQRYFGCRCRLATLRIGQFYISSFCWRLLALINQAKLAKQLT
jgi:hypothetical protein